MMKKITEHWGKIIGGSPQRAVGLKKPRKRQIVVNTAEYNPADPISCGF
jgi:hypothetical protein